MDQPTYGLDWVCEVLDCTPPAASTSAPGMSWGVPRDALGAPAAGQGPAGATGTAPGTSSGSPPVNVVAGTKGRGRGSSAVYPGCKGEPGSLSGEAPLGAWASPQGAPWDPQGVELSLTPTKAEGGTPAVYRGHAQVTPDAIARMLETFLESPSHACSPGARPFPPPNPFGGGANPSASAGKGLAEQDAQGMDVDRSVDLGETQNPEHQERPQQQEEEQQQHPQQQKQQQHQQKQQQHQQQQQQQQPTPARTSSTAPALEMGEGTHSVPGAVASTIPPAHVTHTALPSSHTHGPAGTVPWTAVQPPPALLSQVPATPRGSSQVTAQPSQIPPSSQERVPSSPASAPVSHSGTGPWQSTSHPNPLHSSVPGVPTVVSAAGLGAPSAGHPSQTPSQLSGQPGSQQSFQLSSHHALIEAKSLLQALAERIRVPTLPPQGQPTGPSPGQSMPPPPEQSMGPSPGHSRGVPPDHPKGPSPGQSMSPPPAPRRETSHGHSVDERPPFASSHSVPGPPPSRAAQIQCPRSQTLPAAPTAVPASFSTAVTAAQGRHVAASEDPSKMAGAGLHGAAQQHSETGTQGHTPSGTRSDCGVPPVPPDGASPPGTGKGLPEEQKAVLLDLLARLLAGGSNPPRSNPASGPAAEMPHLPTVRHGPAPEVPSGSGAPEGRQGAPETQHAPAVLGQGQGQLAADRALSRAGHKEAGAVKAEVYSPISPRPQPHQHPLSHSHSQSPSNPQAEAQPQPHTQPRLQPNYQPHQPHASGAEHTSAEASGGRGQDQVGAKGVEAGGAGWPGKAPELGPVEGGSEGRGGPMQGQSEVGSEGRGGAVKVRSEGGSGPTSPTCSTWNECPDEGGNRVVWCGEGKRKRILRERQRRSKMRDQVKRLRDALPPQVVESVPQDALSIISAAAGYLEHIKDNEGALSSALCQSNTVSPSATCGALKQQAQIPPSDCMDVCPGLDSP